ncbi:MAG: YraN family protein [Rhodospirillales bacterium]|nr:YraN family protein [Rhodospirillales bacterium]
MMVSQRRLRAWTLGLRAETLATWLLKIKGYRILERRYKTPVGEIDIVARRGRLLVFTEVKARADEAAAAYSISPGQRRRIERTAEAFLSRNPGLAQMDMRFDVIFVLPGRWPRHRISAWRMGE